MLKRCSHCQGEAQLSVVCVISTLGSTPRRQKCSAAVLFCHRCLRALLAGGCLGIAGLKKSVNNAFTRLTAPLRDGTDPGEPASNPALTA